MTSNSSELAERELTPEERLQWLRDHGIIIETPEDRKAAAATPAPPPSSSTEEAITYVYIPADKSKPLQDFQFVPPTSSSSNTTAFGAWMGGDPLSESLKFAFANDSHKFDTDLFRQSQNPNTIHEIGSSQQALSVSNESILNVATQGHVETFSLVHPTPSNRFTAVNMYLDEVGQMKRLPLNTRASDLAKAAGYNPPPIFYGDMFVARVQNKRREPLKYLTLSAADCHLEAPWLQQAAAQNLEYQMQLNEITGKRGETQPAVAGSDGVAKEEDGGYAWTQTEEEVELVIPLPSTADTPLTAKNISVIFKTRKVQASIKDEGKPMLSIELFERIDVDACTWTLAKGEAPQLIVQLEKAEKAMWPRLVS